MVEEDDPTPVMVVLLMAVVEQGFDHRRGNAALLAPRLGMMGQGCHDQSY